MRKEPKNSDSLTNSAGVENTPEPEVSNDHPEAFTASSLLASLLRPLMRLGEEIKAMLFDTQGYIKLDYFTLFWLFVSGSVIGLGLETIYHALVFGGLESRAGLVWGPFSPIYGVGAVLLTVFLNRYHHSHNLVVFLVSMAIGSVIEYGASWGMEVFWGAIAWDYTGTFGSIQGRTNFFFGVMWGMLGLIWVRLVMPLVKRLFSYVDQKNAVVRFITIALSLFMAIDILCTCLALGRQYERECGIVASNPVEVFFDETFPDSFLQDRFENMGRC